MILRKILLTPLPQGIFSPCLDATCRTEQTVQCPVHGWLFGCAGFTTGLQAAGAALAYAQEQKKGELKHLVRLKPLTF